MTIQQLEGQQKENQWREQRADNVNGEQEKPGKKREEEWVGFRQGSRLSEEKANKTLKILYINGQSVKKMG